MPSLKRHLCGYPIINVIPNGASRSKLVFWYDGKRDSPTFKEEIRHCPGCGKKLTLASMFGVSVQ